MLIILPLLAAFGGDHCDEVAPAGSYPVAPACMASFCLTPGLAEECASFGSVDENGECEDLSGFLRHFDETDELFAHHVIRQEGEVVVHQLEWQQMVDTREPMAFFADATGELLALGRDPPRLTAPYRYCWGDAVTDNLVAGDLRLLSTCDEFVVDPDYRGSSSEWDPTPPESPYADRGCATVPAIPTGLIGLLATGLARRRA